MKVNWRTTLFGVLGLAAQVAAIVLPKYSAPLNAASQLFLSGGLVSAADAATTQK